MTFLLNISGSRHCVMICEYLFDRTRSGLFGGILFCFIFPFASFKLDHKTAFQAGLISPLLFCRLFWIIQNIQKLNKLKLSIIKENSIVFGVGTQKYKRMHFLKHSLHSKTTSIKLAPKPLGANCNNTLYTFKCVWIIFQVKYNYYFLLMLVFGIYNLP